LDSQDNRHRSRILIVDDERFNLTTLNELLKPDHQIMVAMNGQQAIKAAIAQRPDLILLDINMPEMDGYEACQLLKADPITQNIPIIFITALSDASDETRGLELGAADYITKPFNLNVVKARVNTQLRLKYQSDLLESLAFKDGLTGLYNRRAYDEQIEKEWNRCMRSGESLSLIMLDVDHFKLYNDSYGHAMGDECLRRIGSALSSSSRRASDFVARYGGEEFVVILPNTTRNDAMRVADQIRESVELLNIEHKSSKVTDHVTLSLGVISAVPISEYNAKKFVEGADDMLYKAKSMGRNRAEGATLCKAI